MNPDNELNAYEIDFLQSLMQKARVNPWNTRETLNSIDRKLELMWQARPKWEQEEKHLGLFITINDLRIK